MGQWEGRFGERGKLARPRLYTQEAYSLLDVVDDWERMGTLLDHARAQEA